MTEIKKPHTAVVRAYSKNAEAESIAVDWNYGANKARVTRSRTHLSKMIKKHHPDFDKFNDQEKVDFFTAVQTEAFKLA